MRGSHARRAHPNIAVGLGPNFAGCAGTRQPQCPPPFDVQFLILLVKTLVKTGSRLISSIKST